MPPPIKPSSPLWENFSPNLLAERLRPYNRALETAPNLALENYQGQRNSGFVALFCVGGPHDGEYLLSPPLEYRLITLNCHQCDAWVHTSLDLTPLLLTQITEFIHEQ